MFLSVYSLPPLHILSETLISEDFCMTLKTNFYRFLFISILGTLLHFTYEWSHNNAVVGLFSAVNESAWEHLKLLFFPMFFLTLIELFFFRQTLPQNFLKARATGIFLGMTLIIGVFYILLGVIGKSIDFLNIVLYFVAVFFALWVENKQYKTFPEETLKASSMAFSILLIFTLFFFIFTFWSPDIGLFWEVTRVC